MASLWDWLSLNQLTLPRSVTCLDQVKQLKIDINTVTDKTKKTAYQQKVKCECQSVLCVVMGRCVHS